jgi:hypothetical protein
MKVKILERSTSISIVPGLAKLFAMLANFITNI